MQQDQKKTTTGKRKMQELTEAEQAAAIAEMETIIDADAAQRAEKDARRAIEKKWSSVTITLNPRTHAYVKGISEATGKTIRRICADIVQAEAEAHTDDTDKE